jgi:hypothetical protein
LLAADARGVLFSVLFFSVGAKVICNVLFQNHHAAPKFGADV